MDRKSLLQSRSYVVGIFLMLLIALAAVAAAAPAVLPKPAQMTYVADTAAMISNEDAAKIAEMGRGLDAAPGAQVLVVTISSLDGASIEEYATTLFRNWGIGDAEKNNGVLLLIAKENRKFRIEVGYGLEGAITDGYAGSVLDDMKAGFKSENYSEAIVVAYAKLTQKAYEEYGAEIPENVKEEADASFWSVLLGVAIFFGLMALLVYAVWDTLKDILHLLSSGRLFSDSFGGKRAGQSGDDDSGWHSSDDSGSSGGSFGGGRSGGGGASGGWLSIRVRLECKIATAKGASGWASGRRIYMKGGTILIGLFLVFCLFFGYQYNSVKSARLNVDAAYGQVENQMQRRADLIPNLVNTVKGYMKHEEAQIKAVTDARARLMNAGSPEELGAADAELTGALGKLIAIAENYPDLKANTQFTELMREISGTENRIAVARMDYNEAIRFYNIKIQTFPGTFFADMMGMRPLPQFRAEEKAKEVPQVAF